MKVVKRRELLIEQRISADERERVGHLVAWTNTAKAAVNAYLNAIERDPSATITLTIEQS